MNTKRDYGGWQPSQQGSGVIKLSEGIMASQKKEIAELKVVFNKDGKINQVRCRPVKISFNRRMV